MTEQQARSLVTIAATLIAGAIAALIWGDRAVLAVLAAAVLWLLWDQATVADRCDQALDEADQATRGVDDVKAHLIGLEPPSTGRHADGRPQTYRSAEWSSWIEHESIRKGGDRG